MDGLTITDSIPQYDNKKSEIIVSRKTFAEAIRKFIMTNPSQYYLSKDVYIFRRRNKKLFKLYQF